MNNDTMATASNFCHPISSPKKVNKSKLVKNLTAEAKSIARILATKKPRAREKL